MATFPVIAVVDRALKDAGIPTESVSVGTPDTDRTQWRVQYAAPATPAQRTQGDSLLQTLDPQDPPTITNLKTDLSTGRANDDLIRAIVQGLYEAIPNPPPALDTLAKLRTRILTIYRGLL